MTRDELLRRYADGVRDFNKADLRGVDLNNAYLNGTSLLMADLRGANLHNVKMISADLFMCKFDEDQATDILVALGMVEN